MYKQVLLTCANSILIMMQKRRTILTLLIFCIAIFIISTASAVSILDNINSLFKNIFNTTGDAALASSENKCTDTDKGLDYGIKGRVYGIENGSEFDNTDKCMTEDYLGEYYCKGKKLSGNPYPCINGCKDGACIDHIIVKEKVECVFKNSGKKQKCYTYGPLKMQCSGKNSCTASVKGLKGTMITWKSTCGGFADTVIDGTNESVQFDCNAGFTCKDSDSKNYYSRGFVSSNEWGSERTGDDYCVGNLLYERYCDVGKYSELKTYTCPIDCKNGACVKKSEKTQTCIEYDYSKEYGMTAHYNAGTLTVCKDPNDEDTCKDYADYCSETPGLLVETYCSGNNVYEYKFNCPSGICSNGACVK